MDHEEEQEKRKETDAQRRRRVREAFSSVLATSDGRLVLSTILASTGFESENAALGEACARNEGRRSVGLWLLRALREADMQGFLKLYGEMTNG